MEAAVMERLPKGKIDTVRRTKLYLLQIKEVLNAKEDAEQKKHTRPLSHSVDV
jgi:hypothetical protein